MSLPTSPAVVLAKQDAAIPVTCQQRVAKNQGHSALWKCPRTAGHTLYQLSQGECSSLWFDRLFLAQMRCIQTWGFRAQNPGKVQGCGRAAEQNTELARAGAHGSCYLHHEFFFCSSGLAKTKQKK